MQEVNPSEEDRQPTTPRKMAEGREQSYLSPLEEQLVQECETGEDLDQQLLREREVATHKLWLAFQDSATAVAHLFKDCQHQAGQAAWVPFHESASSVTHLYKEASDVCKQCIDSGTQYGQKKRTRELIAWAKKKRKHIRREELLAFLLDKPYNPQQQQQSQLNTVNDDFYSVVGGKESGSRKRVSSSTGGSNFYDFNLHGPDSKRVRFT